MERYDYRSAVLEDVREWLKNEFDAEDYDIEDRDATREAIYDNLWVNDSVTGNGSGSYTFNTWKAEENLCHNLDLMEEVAQEFGIEALDLGRGAEF